MICGWVTMIMAHIWKQMTTCWESSLHLVLMHGLCIGRLMCRTWVGVQMLDRTLGLNRPACVWSTMLRMTLCNSAATRVTKVVWSR